MTVDKITMPENIIDKMEIILMTQDEMHIDKMTAK
jgi:hypothetical protein